MNRAVSLGGLLCLVATGALGGSGRTEEGAAPDAGAALLQEGQKVFRTCTECHCATDPRIPEDEDWLRMNQTTACIKADDASPRAREALAAYLRSDRVIRPVLVNAAYAPKEGLPHGRVELPEVSGSAFLKTEGEAVARGAPARLRLYWPAGPKGRTLPVPAADYRVITYALYGRGGTDGAERWMMTAANINGCVELTVPDGASVPLDLRPVFVGDAFAKPLEDGVKILYTQTDPHGNVATLSVNGVVRLPEYGVFDANGRQVHHAVFENT